MTRTIILLHATALCFAFMPSDGNAESINFQQHIEPIFREHCRSCHNADEAEADIDLTTFAAVMQGGSVGEVVKAGRPTSSLLYQAITHADGAEAMPPESPKISAEQIALVGQWIREGLIDGEGGQSSLRSVAMPVATSSEKFVAPVPKNLPNTKLTKTVRPPVPVAIAASPGANCFVVSGERQVLIYATKEVVDAASFELIGALPFPEGTIHDLKFGRDGRGLLAAGGRGGHSGRAVLFNVSTGKRIAEIGDEVDSVLSADVSYDYKVIALGCSNKLVKVFDVRSGNLLYKIDKHTDWVTSVAFSPDGKMLATGDRSGGVHVWETDGGVIVYTLDEHKVRIANLTWRSDGKMLASGADDGSVIVWDMGDGWALRNVAAHDEKSKSRYSRRTGVVDLEFAADGSLMTIGRDHFVRHWSPEGEKLSELAVGDGLPTASDLLSGGRQALVGSMDGRINVIDLRTSSIVQRLTLPTE